MTLLLDSFWRAVAYCLHPRVIALSLPEMIILRKVLKIQMIAVFAGIVAVGIMIVGFIFNLVY